MINYKKLNNYNNKKLKEDKCNNYYKIILLILIKKFN